MINCQGISISDETILFQLKKNLQLQDLCARIIRQQVINRAAQEKNITVADDEIQIAADRVRYENRLYHANDTYAWLEAQLITADDWEAALSDCILTEKLAKQLFPTAAIEKFFAENKLDFDQVALYRIVVPYEKLAKEISYAIQEDEISFYEAAHLYDNDPRRRDNCGYEGQLYRWSLKPDISATVFSAEPRRVIGPLTIDDASHLLMVEEFIPPELTPDRYKEIQDRLFNDWIAREIEAWLAAQANTAGVPNGQLTPDNYSPSMGA